MINLLLLLGLGIFAFGFYMLCQPDKGTRVRIFNEKHRNMGEVEEPSLIKNFLYTAGIDKITFQKTDGSTEYGTCMFLGTKLLAIETTTGKTIPHFKLSNKQVAEIEKLKGGMVHEEK